MGVIFSLFQYSYNEYVKDVRKYNVQYYDEKYAMLKNTAEILSQIDTHISINIDGFQKNELDTLVVMSKQLNKSIYYTYIFLDSHKNMDSILINDLTMCNRYLQRILINVNNDSMFSISSKKSIIAIGKILRNEKDEINTFSYTNFLDTF